MTFHDQDEPHAMSTELSDPPTGIDDAEDAFLARRAHIMSAIAPPAVPASTPSFGEPVDEPESTGVSPGATLFGDHADDGDADEPEPPQPAIPSAGFLQLAADDDDEPDDDDDAPAPIPDPGPALAQTRPTSLRDRVASIDWKSPKVLAGFVAVVVVLGLIVLFKPDPAPPPLTITSAPTSSAAPVGPPKDGPITIEASESKCDPDTSMNAFNKRSDVPWKCRMPYGPGQILTIHLGQQYSISQVGCDCSYNKDEEYGKYRAVTKARFIFGPYNANKPCTLEFHCMEQTFDNAARGMVPVPVFPNQVTSTITMVILKTAAPPNAGALGADPGTTADTFAVSGIEIVGHRAS